MQEAEKKAALYVRVSTDAQAEEGYSVEAQKEKLRAQCIVKGYAAYEFYVDAGWSGSNLERPAMRRMIEDIRAGKIASVMVYKLDRISRSQKDTLYLIEDVLMPQGVEFISLNESFDTGSSYGRAMLGILSAFAQLERENIRERTRMGMQARVKAGYWRGGGKAPFGYDYDAQAGILVPNGDAKTVEKMYAMYLSGASAQKIAETFGFKYDRLVTQILKRKSNTGVIVYKGEEYPGRHQAIVSAQTYEETMELMQKRSRSRNYGDSPYLLTGLVECGVCGAKMRYFRHRSETAPEGYRLTLACNSRYRSKAYLVRDPDCSNAILDARALEEKVLEEIFRVGLELEGPGKEDLAFPADLAEPLRERRRVLENRLKRLYIRYGDEAEDEALQAAIEETKAELARLNKRLRAEEAGRAQLQKERRRLAALPGVRQNWPHMTLRERRELLRSLLERIVVEGNRITLYYSFLQE